MDANTKDPRHKSTAILISQVADIADFVRKIRKAQNLTQKEMAGLCNVGVRFVSDLENGKPTLHIGKVIHVLNMLGAVLQLGKRK